MKKILWCLIMVLFFAPVAAWAQDQEPAEPAAAEEPAEEVVVSESKDSEGRWTTTLVPVIWLANNTTNITVGDRSRSVTLRADDALSKFQSGGTVRLDVNNGKWGGFADIFFINLEDTKNAGPRGNIPIKMNVDNTVWQVAGTYRVINKEKFDMDVLAGVRGYSLDLDIDVQPFTGPAGVVRFPGRLASTGISFTDPIIGAKAKYLMTDKWGLDLYGDIGGFGVGSDFTYRLGASVGYSFTKSFALKAGYTVVDFDYSKGSGLDRLEYDSTLYGPTLGASFKF